MSRHERSSWRFPALALCAIAALFACTDLRDVSSPFGSAGARLTFAPRYSLLGGSQSVGEPINRIRLTARVAGTDEIIGTLITDVDPTAEGWNLALDVTLDAEATVLVTVELINVADGIETVQWSGLTDPITVAPSTPSQSVAPVTLYQGPPSNLGVLSLTLAPSDLTLEEGATSSFTASVTGPAGTQVIWSVEDAAIVTIDQNGSLTAVHNGATRIFAVAGPRADTALVTVTQRVNAVTVSPDTQHVHSIGGEAVFTARVLDTHSGDIADAGIAWSVTDNTIAESLGGGRFLARGNGTTSIRATSTTNPAVSGTAVLVVAQSAASLTVDPVVASLDAVGSQRAFSAVVADANGNALDAPIAWRSANPLVATIDSTGNATATGIGTTEISAITGTGGDTIVAHATLTVTQKITAIVIAPDTATLESIGDTVRITATATDANGNSIAGGVVVWSSSMPSVASVDTTGLVHALSNGNANIIARAGNVQKVAEIVVSQRARAVVLAPALDTVAAGDTLRFTASATDANSARIRNARFAWSSSDTTIATIDSTGVARGVRAGNVTIRATHRGLTAEATLTVTSSGPVSIVITPDSAFINAIGFNTTFSATAFDDLGAPLPLVQPSWSSLDPVVATVDSAGTVTAVAAGRARIVASVNPADTAIVIVRQIAASITLDHDSATASVGSTVQLDAQVADSAGARIDSATVLWSSGNASVATVNASGLVTAIAAGSATITASHAGLADSLHFTATAPDLTLVSLIVSPALIDDGDTASVALRIRNDGNAASLPAQVAISIVDAATQTDLVAVVVPVAALAAGDSITLTNSAHVLAPAAVDSFYARATLGTDTIRSALVRVRYAPAAIDATPDSIRFTLAGETANAGANVTDRFGRGITDPAIVWTTSDSMVAIVSNAGVITAGQPGTAVVYATVSGLSDSVHVTVAAPNLTVGFLTALPDTLLEGGVAVLSGVARNTGDADAPPHLARVRIVDAANETVLFSIELPVLPIAAHDSIVLAFPVTIDTLIAWPDSVKAEVLLDADSMIRETNEADNLFVTDVHVVRFRVAAIVATPADITLAAIGDTARIVATPADRYGRPLNDRPIAFQSLDAGVATVDISGLVTAAAAGVTHIVASSEGREDSVVVSVEQVPDALTIETGDAQSGTVNEVVANPLGVRVLDAAGHAVPNAPVTWTPDGTSGSIIEGTSVPTDEQGISRAHWKLGTRSGRQDAEACVEGLGCVAFRAHARPGRAKQVNKRDGSEDQIVIVNRIAPNALELIVSDTFGNPARGTVEWSVAQGNGTLTSPALTVIDTLDGTAGVTWQMPVHKGQFKIEYTVRDEAGTFVTDGDFRATAKPDKPNKGNKRPGSDEQNVTVNQTAADAVALTVTDQFDNAIEGAVVHWSLVPGHVAGTLSASADTTNADGAANVSWNVGTKSGLMRLVYTIFDEDGTTVLVQDTFKAHARAAKAKHANKRPGSDDQEVIVDRIAPNAVELIVTDEFGNPTRGTVEWSVAQGNGTLTSPAITTIDPVTGRAGVTWQMPQRSGQFRIGYVVRDQDDVDVATGEFRATAKPDKPNKGNKRPGSDEQEVTVNQTTPNAVELTVTDQFDNPIEGAIVHWALQAGHQGGTLSALADTTDAAGVAGVSWSVGTKAGVVRLRYTVFDEDDVTILVQDDFKARARAGKAKKAHKSAGDEQDVIVNQVAPTALELTVLDEFDNPTRGTVVWTLAANRGALTTPATVDIDTITGKAIVVWQLPTEKGRYEIAYTVLDELGVVIANGSFHATAKADRPTNANKKTGDGQTGVVAELLDDTARIEVRDQFDNPVAGINVVWLPASGSVPDSTTATDSLGITSAAWTLGTQRGNQSLAATIFNTDGSVLTTLTFTASAKPGNPSRDNQAGLTLVGGPPNVRVSQANRDVQFGQDVLDEYGNLLNSQDVTWRLCAGVHQDGQCTDPQPEIAGLASILASNPVATPPRATLTLLGIGQVTIVASRNGEFIGALVVDILQ